MGCRIVHLEPVLFFLTSFIPINSIESSVWLWKIALYFRKNWSIFWVNPEPTLWIQLFFKTRSEWEKVLEECLPTYRRELLHTPCTTRVLFLSSVTSLPIIETAACTSKGISDVAASIESFLFCFPGVSHWLLCPTWLSLIHVCSLYVDIGPHSSASAAPRGWDSMYHWHQTVPTMNWILISTERRHCPLEGGS